MEFTPSDPAVWQTLSQCIDDENDDAVMALINAGDLGINETSEEGSHSFTPPISAATI